MKRLAAVLALIPCLCATATADTVLVVDFNTGVTSAPPDVTLSIGLPYLIARALNSAPGFQAILPDAPSARLIRTLYDAQGMPDFEQVARARTQAGADRCLLGRAIRSVSAMPEDNAWTVAFYLVGPANARPETFSADIAGDGSIPALAAWTAGKISPSRADAPSLKMPPSLLPPFSQGLRMLREGDPAGAERALFGAVKEHPASPDVHYVLALAAAARGKPYTALRLCNEASNLDAGFSLPPFREGKLWLSLDRATLAEGAFDRAASIQPSFFEALVESGALKTARGDFPAAEKAIGNALKMRPRDPEARYRLADCLARGGKEGQAQRVLAALLSEHGEYGPARYLAGKLFFQAGDYRAAESEARQAVRLMPNDPEAHTLLADALSRQGGLNRHAEAALELRKAIWLKEKAK